MGSRAWRLVRLLDAPHRLAFAAAALVLSASSLWWAAINVSRARDIAVPWGLPSPIAHGVWMTFGFMPLFIIGFLFTAGPRWLKRAPVPAGELLPALLPQLVGWAVFMLAAHGPDIHFGRSLGAIGLLAVTLGWCIASAKFWRLVRSSAVEDRVHLRLIGAGCVIGAAALCAAACGLAAGDFALVRAATLAGLWGFVGLVFATASHRMIPIFSAAAWPLLDAWRPLWLLWSFAAVFALQAAAESIEALALAGTGLWFALRAAVELSAGIGCLALAVRWALVQGLRVRLLAMLHVGFTWLGIVLVMLGLSHATGHSLGLAPLHAFTMGYLGSTMFAFVTRITCGHSGRNVTTDNFIWRLFWLLQLAIVARLAAALLPAFGIDWGPALLAASALAWAGLCVAWSVRYGYWYGTPRPDGQARVTVERNLTRARAQVRSPG